MGEGLEVGRETRRETMEGGKMESRDVGLMRN